MPDHRYDDRQRLRWSDGVAGALALGGRARIAWAQEAPGGRHAVPQDAVHLTTGQGGGSATSSGAKPRATTCRIASSQRLVASRTALSFMAVTRSRLRRAWDWSRTSAAKSTRWTPPSGYTGPPGAGWARPLGAVPAAARCAPRRRRGSRAQPAVRADPGTPDTHRVSQPRPPPVPVVDVPLPRWSDTCSRTSPA
jgi:hypothetical protein